MREARIIRFGLLFAVQRIILVTLLASGPAQAATGLDYLVSQQAADGSYITTATSLAAPIQATIESVRVYQLLGQTSQPGYAAALNYLNGSTDADTETLAARITINASDPLITAPWRNELFLRQNVDGGFGAYTGYASTTLDTAFAVEALSVTGQESYQLARAMGYLMANQAVDGSYAGNDNYSSIYVTSIALRALWANRNLSSAVPLALAKAANYLLSQKTAGLWPEQFDTALALIALSPYVSDTSLLADAATGLKNAILADGSWDGDVFTTALALRAINAYDTRLATKPEPNPIPDPTPAPGSAGAIGGHVVKAGTSQPLVGVQVAVSELPGLGVKTDDQGYFLIPGLAAGTYTLTARQSGYNAVSVVAEVRSGQTTLTGNLALSLVPTLSIIQGLVIDSDTRLGLVDTQIRLVGNKTYNGIADANGRYNLGSIEPGTYTVSFERTGFNSVSSNISVQPNQVLDLNIALTRKGYVDDMPGNGFGMVIDGNTKLPIANAVFDLGNGMSAVTNDQGEFFLAGVPRNTYNGSVTATGYETSTFTWVFSPYCSGNLGTTILYPVVATNTAPTTVKLFGSIVDSQSRAPLAGVTITSGGANVPVVSASSAGDGGFTIELPAKSFVLTLALNGYQTAIYNISVSGFGETKATFTLSPTTSPDPDPRPQATYAATGVVVDSVTNQPISGATITAMFNGKTTTHTSDGNGNYLIQDLTETGELTFTRSGYVTTTLPALLAPLTITYLGQTRLRPQAQPAPDLVITSVDRTTVSSDPHTLALTGTLNVEIKNQGTGDLVQEVKVLAFHDVNKNGNYDQDADVWLGEANVPPPLAVASSSSVSVKLQGKSFFRDATIAALIDSTDAVVELNEKNNYKTSAASCEVKPPVGSFNPVLKWEWSSTSVLPSYTQVMSAPIVAPLQDTNADGKIDQFDTPAIIFHTFSGWNYESDGVLRAISGKDGSEIWTVTDPAYRTNGSGSMPVADLDGDGAVEIVVPKSGGGVIVFDHNGKYLWHSPYTAVRWGGAAIADLDGDGKAEIIVGYTAFNFDGTRRWVAPACGVYDHTLPFVADINLDGSPEIILGGCAFSNRGELLWKNSSANGFAAVGNFNADPYPEIVAKGLGSLYMLDHTGAKIWGPVSLPGGGYGGPPTIADVDGDGVPEIGIAGASRYTIFKADGSILWSSPTQDYSSTITGSSVFDFEGDGKSEVVYADEQNLRIFRGNDGAVLFRYPNTSGTTLELPVIADIDNDNHADIVICANGTNRGIRAFQDKNNSWVNTRKIWNQHTYHITNINDDGTVPRVEQNSWQTHNTYRLNTFPDRSATGVPDLTTSLLKLIDNGAGLPASLTVRIGNGGAAPSPDAVVVSFYQGDPAAGGLLLGSSTLAPLAINEYRDLRLDNVALSGNADIFVVADSSNKVTECNEANNSLSIKLPAATLGLISVSTDKSTYGPNEGMSLSATVTNIAGLASNYAVEFVIEDTKGTMVTSFTPIEVTGLPSTSKAAVGQTFNTGTTLIGTYVLRGILRNSEDTILHVAQSRFTIGSVEGAPTLLLRLSTDRSSYNTTDLVNISVLAANNTVNTVISNTIIRITVTNSTGQAVFTQESDLAQLPPGGLRDLLLPYHLDSVPVGTYTITARVINNTTQSVLATATAQYRVVSDLNKSLSATVTPALASLDVGTSQACTTTLTNKGSTAVSGLQIHESMVNIDTQTLAHEATSEIALLAGASTTSARTFSTSGLVEGNYACVIQALIDGSLKTLAYAPFKLTLPPIRIDGELKIGAHGRLLVLIDTANRCEGTNSQGTQASNSSTQGNASGQACAKDEDPYGPKNAPKLSEQRAFLEALLKNEGWSYTITESAAAFTQAFHTGTYSAYALFSEQEKLTELTHKELREAIFRGEGLLAAGPHDGRNQHYEELNDALGIKLIGSVADAVRLEIPNNSLELPVTLSLYQDDKAIRIKREGAQSLGIYSLNGTPVPDPEDCRDPADPTVTIANCYSYLDGLTETAYGEGKSIFAGFDLLAVATRDGQTSDAAKLLKKALLRIAPIPKAIIGATLPLDVILTNKGMATEARVIVTLPAGVTVIDANGAQVANTQTPGESATWTTNLDIGEEEKKTLYLRLPKEAGTIQINATVEAPVGGNYQLFSSPSLTVTVPEVTTLEVIGKTLESLSTTKSRYSKGLKQAQTDLDRAIAAKSAEDQIAYAIKATDALIGISDPDITTARIDIDRWVRLERLQAP